MSKKIVHAVTLVLLALGCTGLFWLMWQWVSPDLSITYELVEELPTEQTGDSDSRDQTTDTRLLLQTYQGRIALYSTPYQTPDEVYDIYVNTLPVLDQQRLAMGIFLEDDDTLATYLADFES